MSQFAIENRLKGAAPRLLFVSDQLAIPGDHGGRTYSFALLTYLAAHGCAIDYFCLDPLLPPGTLLQRYPSGATYLARLWSPHHVRAGTLLAQRSPATCLRWYIRTLREWIYRFDAKHGFALKRIYRALASRADSESAPSSESPQWTLPSAHLAVFRKALRRAQPDVVMVDYTRFAPVLDHVPANVHKIVLTHDIIHQRAASYARLGTTADFQMHDRRWETALLLKADTIVAIQHTDAQTLCKMLPDRRVIAAPMPAMVPRKRANITIRGRCMFIGGSSQANIDGITWFLREVWPRVLALAPMATLCVYGKVCARLTGAFPRTTLVGPVTDLSHAYGQAALCLVPLRIGSGLKIKLVEAAAHGRAVVSTWTGLQGLESLACEAVPVADEPEQFSQWTARLLLDDALRDSFAQKLSTWAAEQLSPEATFAELRCALWP